MKKRAGPDVGPWLLYDRTGAGAVGGELSPGRGAGVGLPGVPGPQGRGERVHRARAPGAPLSGRGRPGREPPALVLWGSGCAQPGEERKTTGGEGGSGREGASGVRGGHPPPGQPPRAGGTQVPGPLGPRGRRRAHAPRPGGSSAPPPAPTPPSERPGAPGRGRVTLGAPLLAFSLVPVAPPATGGRVGGPAAHPLPAPINPCGPVSVLGPALSPGLRASPPSRGCRGWGREKVSGLSPVLQAPAPPRSSPRATHQIEAALH